MMKRFFSILRYICLLWLIVYLLISIIKFVQINYKINEKYGLSAQKFTIVGYTNESVVIDYILLILDRTVFPHFNPLYRYGVPNKMSSTLELKPKFMQNKFQVTMRGGKVVEDTFSSILTTDPKFQHLYSEWVKKQVGIEDENVELEFNSLEMGSKLAGDDVYIDFSKIKNFDKLEEQICENTKNYYLKSIDVKIVDENIQDKWLDKAKNVKDEFLKKVSNSKLNLMWNNKLIIKLYYYDVDLVYDRYNRTKVNKNNKNFYYVQFDLKNNSIKYMSDYCDNTFATVLDNWLKDIVIN